MVRLATAVYQVGQIGKIAGKRIDGDKRGTGFDFATNKW
jgi:hypothetical protein